MTVGHTLSLKNDIFNVNYLVSLWQETEKEEEILQAISNWNNFGQSRVVRFCLLYKHVPFLSSSLPLQYETEVWNFFVFSYKF
jgi:hypothetical protein